MRRTTLAAVVAASLVAGGVTLAAQAKQVIPMHTADITKVLSQHFRAVRIAADTADVHLATGRTSRLHLHEEWNFNRPVLTVTVSHGVLKIGINCGGDVTVAGGVVVQGASSLANDCMETLRLTLPASVPVSADTGQGAITSRGARGGLDLSTGSGDVSVQNARGASVKLSSGQGTVTTTHITASAVELNSDAGSVSATDTSGDSVRMDSGQGAVTATRVTSRLVSLESGAGSVTGTRLTGRSMHLHSEQGEVKATGVRTAGLTAATDAGSVTLTNVRAEIVTARSGQGAVAVSHVRTRNLQATSDAGNVSADGIDAHLVSLHSGQGVVSLDAARCALADVSSDAGNVAVELDALTVGVTAKSGQGAVDVTVPAGRYDVSADSDQGSAKVNGVIIDTSVDRFVRAHSGAGNVTVTGN